MADLAGWMAAEMRATDGASQGTNAAAHANEVGFDPQSGDRKPISQLSDTAQYLFDQWLKRRESFAGSKAHGLEARPSQGSCDHLRHSGLKPDA